MAQKRELLIVSKDDKRYIRRDGEGKFTTDQVDVSKSLKADNNQQAKRVTPPGQGDKGDHRRK